MTQLQAGIKLECAQILCSMCTPVFNDLVSEGIVHGSIVSVGDDQNGTSGRGITACCGSHCVPQVKKLDEGSDGEAGISIFWTNSFLQLIIPPPVKIGQPAQ
jgi:hypothetical protein